MKLKDSSVAESSDVDPKKSVDEKPKYAEPDELRAVLEQLRGRKFMLDCGHKVTFGYFLGNNVIIHNGKEFKIICTDCGY